MDLHGRSVRCALALLFVGMLVGCGRSVTPAAQEELKRLEGTWEGVGRIKNGEAVPFPGEGPFRLVIKGDRYSIHSGEQKHGEGSLHLEVGSVPKAVDFIVRTESLHGGTATETMQGVYELKGDELFICLAPPPQKRPASVEAKAGSGQMADRFKRVSK